MGTVNTLGSTSSDLYSGSREETTNGYLVSKGYAWYIYSLLFMLMIFDYIDRSCIASIFPFLKEAWSLSDLQCGTITSALNWSITICALPAGFLADRWSRKKTVGLMSTIWSLATLVCAWTQNYFQLFVSRIFIGTGEAGYVPVGCALMSAMFPKTLRGKLIGLFMGAGAIGSAIGLAVGSWIAVSWGWRYVFGVVAIPGLIFAIMFFFTRDYKTVELTIRASEAKDSAIRRNMTTKDILVSLFGVPSALAIYLNTILGLFFIAVVLTWLPTFFIRVAKLPVAEAGTRAGMIVVVAIGGNFLVGHLADWVVRRGTINGYPLVAAGSQLCTWLLFGAAFGLAQGQAQFWLLALGALVFAAFLSPTYSALQELVHAGLRSSVISVNVLLGNLFGMGVGPVVVGALSDRYGIGAAMVIASFVPLISAMVCLVAAFFYNQDVAKVEKVKLQIED